LRVSAEIPAKEKKSGAGRKPIDVIVMFRMLVLQSLYNLSDEQAEYQVRDRLSFTRFLRLGFEDSVPDGTTLWLFREALAKAGLIERLFERFGHHLEAKGYIARGGQMVDARDFFMARRRRGVSLNRKALGAVPVDARRGDYASFGGYVEHAAVTRLPSCGGLFHSPTSRKTADLGTAHGLRLASYRCSNRGSHRPCSVRYSAVQKGPPC
jgi:IS5 family transposase